MKKLTAFLLACLMLIPMMTMGIGAETLFDPSADDSLVLHYDFAGEQPYANKASKAQDPALPENGGLTVKASGLVCDGVQGTVTNSANGAALTVSRSYVAGYMTGKVEYTFFARVKLDSDLAANETTSDIYYNVADMRVTTSGNGYRAFALQYVDRKAGSTSKDSLGLYISSTANRSAAKGVTVALDFETVKAQFVNVAVMVYNGGTDSAPNYQAKVYYSVGPQTAWTESAALAIGEDICEAQTDMKLLSMANSSPKGIILDDLRLYRKVLSLENISRIVSNEFAQSTDMSDYLAIHYDFDGENYLENKASNSAKGDLSVSANDVIEHDPSIGTVTKTDSGKGGLYLSKNEVADLIAGGLYDADINVAGKAVEYTLFSRFRLDDMVKDVEYRIIDTRSFGSATCRPLNVTYKNGTLMVGVGAASGQNTSGSQKNIKIAEMDMETRFVNLAVVVYNAANEGETPKMKLAIYYSQGNPSGASDWTKAFDDIVKDASGANASTVSPINQNLYLLDMNNGGFGVEMDDFRVYTKALSSDEVYKIMEEGSFAPDIVNVGHQQLMGDDFYNVRFLGGINSLDYDEVGFEIITMIGSEAADTPLVVTSSAVYGSMMADGEEVAASAYFCEYFIAFTVTEIPKELSDGVTFCYRFFGVRDGVKYYSEYGTAAYNADGTLAN